MPELRSFNPVRGWRGLLAFIALLFGPGASRAADAQGIISFLNCPPDAVKVGPSCVDRYEASIWKTSDRALIFRIRLGTATLADLTAGGATQLGLSRGDLEAAGCPASGNGCLGFFAVSVPGVRPAGWVSWFQAAAAARNSGKRLLTNAEWQAAALGTADPGENPGPDDCNTYSGALGLTGSHANCVSEAGVLDMVGNQWEWVADWVPLSTACPGWGSFADDDMCLAGASTTGGPGALFRGGSFSLGRSGGRYGGVFAVQDATPRDGGDDIGFRATR